MSDPMALPTTIESEKEFEWMWERQEKMEFRCSMAHILISDHNGQYDVNWKANFLWKIAVYMTEEARRLAKITGINVRIPVPKVDTSSYSQNLHMYDMACNAAARCYKACMSFANSAMLEYMCSWEAISVVNVNFEPLRGLIHDKLNYWWTTYSTTGINAGHGWFVHSALRISAFDLLYTTMSPRTGYEVEEFIREGMSRNGLELRQPMLLADATHLSKAGGNPLELRNAARFLIVCWAMHERLQDASLSPAVGA